MKNTHFSWTINGQITFMNTKITSLSGSHSGFNVSTDDIAGGVAEGRGLSDYPITYLKMDKIYTIESRY
ncbi:MAG TPA: hypothetical protein VFX43_06530 [Chitinophagaceae bacterium]|nr:hypothetical protein [Chitinophagaceae bacterium]